MLRSKVEEHLDLTNQESIDPAVGLMDLRLNFSSLVLLIS